MPTASAILSKLGTPQDQRVQQFRTEQARNRLTSLARTQQQYDDYAATRNAAPHTGPDYSGYTNEHEYRQGLNRQGEMAGLMGELSGEGKQVQHSYAGTDFAMGPAARSLTRAAAAPAADEQPSDNLDYYSRLEALRGQQVNNQRQREAAFSESTADDPYFAQQRGDVKRDEMVRDAGALGRAEFEHWRTPGQEEMKRQNLWDLEEQRRRLAPYDPAKTRATAATDVADINRDAKLGAAEISGNARTGASAMSSLGRVAGSLGLTEERLNSIIDAVRANVPGMSAGGQPPAGGQAPDAGEPMKPFPRERMGALMQRFGLATEAQALDWLRQNGYAVQ